MWYKCLNPFKYFYHWRAYTNEAGKKKINDLRVSKKKKKMSWAIPMAWWLREPDPTWPPAQFKSQPWLEKPTRNTPVNACPKLQHSKQIKEKGLRHDHALSGNSFSFSLPISLSPSGKCTNPLEFFFLISFLMTT